MTFDDFKALALNPPYTPEPAVYRIDVYRIIERDSGKSCLTILPEEDIRDVFSRLDDISDEPDDGTEYYPEYKVYKCQSFVMPTFEEAKRLIHSEKLSKDD